MPTIHRFNGLRVVIYLNDHRPAHVHVVGAGAVAVFELNCPDGPPSLHENYGFKRSALADIKAELAAVLPRLCKEWSDLHGCF